jgi:hypothetical protein
MKYKKQWLIAAFLITSYLMGFVFKSILWFYWPFDGIFSEIFQFFIGVAFVSIMVTIYYALKSINENYDDGDDDFVI